MRRAARSDESRGDVVEALRAVGCWVFDVKQPFDLLVAFRGAWHVLEVKRPLGPRGGDLSRLTPAQRRWLEQIGPRARVHIVRTGDDALRAVGAIREAS
jgi:hypothetical protein